MTIAGYGVRFGGVDLTGDSFSPDCDFWINDGRLSPNPPVMFEHGRDQFMRKAVVGRVTSTRVDSIGLWVEAQLKASKAYMDAIRKLVAAGVIGWSSGSAPQFVERTKSLTPDARHSIVSWGVIECSLTPNPAEPRCLNVRELKSLATADPLLLPIAREAEQITREAKAAMSDLPDSAFAFVEAGGTLVEGKSFPLDKRHYSHHDESGVVDPDALTEAVDQAFKATNPAGLAHLLRHQHAIDTGHADDAHSHVWDGTAAAGMLVACTKGIRLADDLAADQIALERTGIQTKSGSRIIANRRTQVENVHQEIGYLIENADRIERGDDGTAQVALYRAAFDLLDLEEVA